MYYLSIVRAALSSIGYSPDLVQVCVARAVCVHTHTHTLSLSLCVCALPLPVAPSLFLLSHSRRQLRRAQQQDNRVVARERKQRAGNRYCPLAAAQVELN